MGREGSHENIGDTQTFNQKLKMSLGRYFRTLSKLKASQIYFQIYYKIKSLFSFRVNNRHFQRDIFPLKSKCFPFFKAQKIVGKNTFTFLSITHHFEKDIDWNVSINGRLWNYHLQYLDFLNDDALSLQERINLLEDISKSILEGSLRLEPFPVSIRLINSLVFLHRLPDRKTNIDKALLKQIYFLKSNLEYHILANHLLENLLAMCLASHFIKDRLLILKFTEKLTKELDKQILPDGAHYERSIMYHMIIMGRLMTLYSLPNLDHGLIFSLKNYLSLMSSWLYTFVGNENALPLFQDSSGNECLSPGTLLVKCDQLQIPYQTSQLKECGYRKFSFRNASLWVNGGNISPEYQPGHSHADLLNFILHVNHIPHIVDTGVSTYEANDRRNYERGSYAHNVVVIDGKDQSEMWRSFRIGRRARLSIIQDNSDSLVGEIDQLFRPEWKHQRSFSIQDSDLVIHDKVMGGGNVNCISLYHFDKDISSIFIDQKSGTVEAGLIKINFEGAENIVLEEYLQAVGFNHLENAMCLKVDFKKSLVTKIKVHG